MQDQMQREAAAKSEAEAERRRMMTEVARSLDQQVKAVADAVGTAAQSLVDTARSMQSVSRQSRHEASDASAASTTAAGQWRA